MDEPIQLSETEKKALASIANKLKKGERPMYVIAENGYVFTAHVEETI